MTATLTSIPKELTSIRSTLAGVLSFIESASEPDALADAKARIKLAREWAKIHKVASETHLDLLRIEALCLRRIAAVDALDILGVHERSAAKFFLTLDDEGIADVISEFSRASTAIGVFRAFEREQRDRTHRAHGRRVASGEQYDEPDEHFEVSARYYTTSVRAALAVLVDEFAAYTAPFTVADMADDLIEEIGLTETQHDPKLREGIAEVCRAAIRKAAPSVVDGFTVPRFVTCYIEDGDGFVRIPFNNARVQQLEQMVALRREQLEQDQAAFAKLQRLYARIREASKSPTDRIGDLVETDGFLRWDMPTDRNFARAESRRAS